MFIIYQNNSLGVSALFFNKSKVNKTSRAMNDIIPMNTKIYEWLKGKNLRC